MKKKKTLLVAFALLIVAVLVLAATEVIEETLGMIIALGLTVIFTIVMAVIAMRHDALLVSVLMILFTILGSGLLFVNVNNFVNGSGESTKKEFLIEVTPSDTEKEKLFSINDKNFYTYRLKQDIFVKMDSGESYSLKDALFYGHVTLDEIAALAIQDDDTTGYRLYYDGGDDSSEKNKYALIICENSNDVIFGNYDLSYDQSICTNGEG